MKTTKIIFPLVLLAVLATTALAKDIDRTAENYRQTAKRFVHVLSEQWGIGPERVAGETYFLREFGADALDIVELIMALEEEFDIEIPDAEWDRITTVDSAVELIVEISDRPSLW